MVTVSAEAKSIIHALSAEFVGFTGLPILSELYVSKAENLNGLVLALAKRHPRWSAEDEAILPFPEDGDWFEWKENSLFHIYELTEDLLWGWNKMNASAPTAESLVFLMRFSGALNALYGKAEAL